MDVPNVIKSSKNAFDEKIAHLKRTTLNLLWFLNKEKKIEEIRDAKCCKCIYFLFSFFLFGSAIAMTVYGIVGVYHVPVLAPIYSRLLTSGISLIIQSMFSMIGSKILCCTCCCFCCQGASGFMKTFISSFSVGFELFLFGGMYLFWLGFWKDATVLDGRISGSINYDVGGNIDALLNHHLHYGLATAILCLVAFFIIIVSSLIAMYLLTPKLFLKKIDGIPLVICSVISAEYVFIGSWLSVATVYSDFYQIYFRAFLIMGIVCSVGVIVITVLKFLGCGGFCTGTVIILRVLVYITLFAGAFIAIFTVYPRRAAHHQYLLDRWGDCPGLSLVEPPTVGGSAFSSLDTLQSFPHTTPSALPMAHTLVLTEMEREFDAGALRRRGHGLWNADTTMSCRAVQLRIEMVYGCSFNASVEGNEKYCDDLSDTARTLLIRAAEGYQSLFGFCGVWVLVSLVLSIVFWVMDVLAERHYVEEEDENKTLVEETE